MNAGILSGPAICRARKLGSLSITPFDLKQVNSASYDVHLGAKYGVYDRWLVERSDAPHRYICTDKVLDVKNPDHYKVTVRDIPDIGLVVEPGQLFLMHTQEIITTSKYEPILDGKSSVGRVGTFIHITAGYGDPYFDGQYTLEVTVVHPIRLYAGMLIGQMRFHTLVGTPPNYQTKGNYVGEAAQGPVASKLWKQFTSG